MLAPGALRYRGWKKRLAWPLYQERDLGAAEVIHVTSTDEARSVRQMGCFQPIAVIPNGVAVPPVVPGPHPLRPRRRALFLSRIHPIKGILTLVSAWAHVRPHGWELLIAGPDFDGHRAEVEALVRRERLSEVITISDPVTDDEKWKVFAESDLFVLPTVTENFGIVVAEALASGVPVITTTGAPWEAVATNGCGWWIEPGVEALRSALEEATTMTDSQRHELGRKGRAYVAREFSWQHIAQDMREVYRWMVDGGQAPGSMRLD
jgi:glycosyltransferase involved in cell wall biosynthesis